MHKYFITGARRGLGKALHDKLNCVDTLEECDIFINCKHDGFQQVDLLYKAADLGLQIVNIGSAASDWTKGYKPGFRYAIEKKSLRDVNDALFWEGVTTTIINFGYFNSERSADVDTPKMDLEYCVGIVEWVLAQPYRLKELTVCPSI
jgi:hypothetical protein